VRFLPASYGLMKGLLTGAVTFSLFFLAVLITGLATQRVLRRRAGTVGVAAALERV
jgi:hypothetical protein